jgi:ribonuclease E
MTKRMLIDATHAEETRVVVMDGNRLEDFDVETSTKKQLKGNIYLAKVVRVEPSLQAAFVEYGGGRHGFLAFGEIHPDYYQIPVADRQRLLEIAAEEAREEEEAEERLQAELERQFEDGDEPTEAGEIAIEEDAAPAEASADAAEPPASLAAEIDADVIYGGPAPDAEPAPGAETVETQAEAVAEGEVLPPPDIDADLPDSIEIAETDSAPPEMLGGTADQFEGNGAEEATRRRASRMLRSYRIQEVIRRRQILLIQVVKEERGNKGAALTTYISLAGRYCVLMPNSPRGGGISRKITSAADRKRLKEITSELEIPKGMGLIVRTAGANRPKPEIKRDCEYLMRLWDDIRELTLRSMAPALIYEEASLIKRSIRDVYSRDVDEVIVDGEDGWKQARDFMRMLMPSHASKVQLWRPQGIQLPLFAKHQVDMQLDLMVSPTVQLRSGGYIVINQTEALVAIDVNSGRSTRERGIEETALKTNLEAADEIARQLRLRDLAGLIVIDFIDMESRKANAAVERRIKEALKNDRARIQLGAISHFGLLEMSRQRLRPSLAETSFVTCPHCQGLGHVRSVESSAIHVLRAVEEEGAKLRAAAILVYASPAVVMYILNNKRDRLAEIEARYAMRVSFAGDDTLLAPATRIDRLRPQVPEAERLLAAAPVAAAPLLVEEDEDAEADVDVESDAGEDEPRAGGPAAGATEEGDQRRRRRRRRRGGRREGPGADRAEAGEESEETGSDDDAGVEAAEPGEDEASAPVEAGQGETDAGEEAADGRGRRRGRRGGRRRRRGEAGDVASEAVSEGEADEAAPVAASYSGPTPADPFNTGFDIFDILDRAEEAAAVPAAPVVRQVPILNHPPETAEPSGRIVPDEAAEPAATADIEPAPASVVEIAVAPAAEPVVETTAEPVAEAALPEATMSETTPPEPAAPTAAPAPVALADAALAAVEIAAIAADITPTEPAPVAEPEPVLPKKTGWWRR